MLNTPGFTEKQRNTLRRIFHAMNHFMVWMWKIGMGKLLNLWPAVGGRIMVIEHRGRRSGRKYLTPVNYGIIDGEIFCMAGFGARTDWYRNIMADPRVRLWLPQGQQGARATDVSDSPQRPRLLREIIIASGFAGPLFGVDQRKLTDEQMLTIAKDYRIVQFERDG